MQKDFKFTAAEYAKLSNITESAVRKRRLAGKLDGQYKFENGKYFYQSPLKGRPLQDEFTPKIHAKKRRRHVPRDQVKYTKPHMQAANDFKQLFAINGRLKKAELDYITEDVIKIAKERHQQQLQLKLNENDKKIKNSNMFSKYGRGIYDARNLPIPNKKIKYQDEIEDEEREFWSKKYY